MCAYLRIALPFLFAAFLLSGCKEATPRNLPPGEQEISGVLKVAEISVTRRGTHIIAIDGIDTYFAESALLSLRDYQGKRVTLRGTLEENISLLDLPVFKVTSVVRVEETAKEFDILEYGVSLRTPVEWLSVQSGAAMEFRVEDIELPILVITLEQEASELPDGGMPIVIASERAQRFIDELSGMQIIAVKRRNGILTFTFHPRGSVRAERLREDFLELLSTLRFAEENAESREGSQTETGALGLPCGGEAGILCPKGSFCEIQDVERSIGHCRKIVRSEKGVR